MFFWFGNGKAAFSKEATLFGDEETRYFNPKQKRLGLLGIMTQQPPALVYEFRRNDWTHNGCYTVTSNIHTSGQVLQLHEAFNRTDSRVFFIADK